MIHLHLMDPGFSATGNLISTIQMLISLCVLETEAQRCASISAVFLCHVLAGTGVAGPPADTQHMLHNIGFGVGREWECWEQTWEEEIGSTLENAVEGERDCGQENSLHWTFFPFHCKYAHLFPLLPREHCQKKPQTVNKRIFPKCIYS